MSVATPPSIAPPSGLTGRSIAPDLARGMMLLLIAVANAPFYLWTQQTGFTSAHPLEGSVADRVAQTIAIVAVDGRTYPMFAFLFGYGIWQLYRRQLDAGTSPADARRLLRRRHLWMIAFGGVHAALLWMGDVVGAYGLAGLVLTAIFLDRRDLVLRIWAVVLIVLLALGAVSAALSAWALGTFAPAAIAEFDEVDVSLHGPTAQPDYLLSVLERFGFWLLLAPAQGLLTLVIPAAILIALLAARHRVLEEPEAHRPLLRRVAVVGISLGWSAGALSAMQHLGVFGIPPTLGWAFSGLHAVTGLCCGIGYVAVFGLIAARMRSRGTTGGPVARAIQAVGKRSLTFYLAQSVVFAPVMSAWGLGVGASLSSWSIALVAVGVWVASVVVAAIMERAGVRGPAEVLLRRLAYGRSR